MVFALLKQGTRFVFEAGAFKKFAVSPRGGPLFTNIKGFHVRNAVEKMPEKGKVKEQPSSVEERLPRWAQTLLKLEAQVESSQPAKTQGPEKGEASREG
jgi:hypothetical protein